MAENSIAYQDLLKLLQQQQQRLKPETPTQPRLAEPVTRDPTLAGTNRGPRLVLRCDTNGAQDELQCSIDNDSETGTLSSESDEAKSWGKWFQKYRSSVVQVIAESATISPYTPHENLKNFQARGSAFFITKEGHLLTNCHVVVQCLQCFIRRESEGEKFLPVDILAICPSKDLALLQIPAREIAKLKEPIVPLPFGDSDLLEVGMETSAFGFQLGMPDIKMTIGNLTGYHRESDGLGDENRVSSYLQMSSAVNSGSSGGNLLNSSGQVVGVVSAGIPGASAFGFSIPSKVVFSILRSLFSSEKVYPEKIIPVPTLPFFWQTTNHSLLRAQNVDPQYFGGLYVTQRMNPYMKRPSPDHDIQARDVIVEIRCINPYTAKKDYLNIENYRKPWFFPESKSAPPMSGSSETHLARFLLQPEDKCMESIVIQDVVENEQEQQFLNGGVQWNLSAEHAYPAFKITFQPGDETITIFEKHSLSEPWILSPLYEHRKMFITDFLDLLPTGLPLLFLIYRNGRKICLERKFTPVLPRNQGLKKVYPPFQDYKNRYEILAGLVLMDLDLNHYKVCLPHLMERLEGKKKFESAVVITHLFNLSSVSRMGLVEPLGILESMELFAPELNSSTTAAVVHYKKIGQSSSLTNMDEVRGTLLFLVNQGIAYYQKVIEPNLKLFQRYLFTHSLRSKIQSMRAAKRSWTEIDEILSQKYKVRTSTLTLNREEDSLIQKYLPQLKQSKAWHQLLTLNLNFHHGISLYVGFPEIFMEDFQVQSKLQVPLTPFAEKLYAKINAELISKFNSLFQVGSESTLERRVTSTDLRKFTP